MNDICTDNRFEMIKKYRELLKENTNIETSYEEMQMINNILFRFWQMGWLDKIESADAKHGEWKEVTNGRGDHECSLCGNYALDYQSGVENLSDFCPHCGADMRERRENDE